MRFNYYHRLTRHQQGIYRKSDSIVAVPIPDGAPLVPIVSGINEFCHHLDYEFFKLAETFHTAGFYQRESSLMRQLLEQRDSSDTR